MSIDDDKVKSEAMKPAPVKQNISLNLAVFIMQDAHEKGFYGEPDG
jgi:hypothetical protein